MIQLLKKDLKLFIKDKRSVLLTFLLPIVLISLFAFAFGGIGNSGESAPITLLIADESNTELSIELTNKLDSIEGLKIIKKDFENAKTSILKGKYIGVLVFHNGLEDSLSLGKDIPIELFYDKAREMEIGMLQPVLISTIMNSIGKEVVTNNIKSYLNETFPDIDDAVSKKILSDINSEEETVSIDSNTAITLTALLAEDKQTNLGLIQAVAGTAILMLLFSVAGLGTSILEEKERGTISRLLYAPISSNAILYSKMLFAFFISITQLTVMFLFSWLVFGLDITYNIPALISMIVATGFAVSGFGVFLAAISKTRQQAQSLSTLIILIMSAIGGSMIPLFVMPAIMQKIAVFSINYWGIQGFYDIFWRKLPFIEIIPRILVLLGIGFVMTMVSLRLFRKNLFKY